MMQFVNRSYGLMALVPLVLGISGCTTASDRVAEAPSEIAVNSEQAREYLSRVMKDRKRGLKEIVAYSSLDEVLPNTVFQAPGRPAQAYSASVVRGRVVDVEKGVGFIVSDSDDAQGTETSFDDPNNLWRTIHLTIEVTEHLGGSPIGSTIIVGYAMSPEDDYELLKAGFLSLPSVVLPLEVSPVFDYAESIWGISGNGSLLILVENGQLSIPALGTEQETKMLDGVPTYAELKAEASDPTTIVPAETSGEGLVAAD